MSSNSQQQGQNKKSYLKYSRSMRIRLIQLVEKEKMSTAEAGRVVGIKQTSACRIINSYKKHNRIFEKKADRILRQKHSPDSQEQKTLIDLQKKQKKEGLKDPQNQEGTRVGPPQQEVTLGGLQVALPHFQRPTETFNFGPNLNYVYGPSMPQNPYGIGMPIHWPFPYFC